MIRILKSRFIKVLECINDSKLSKVYEVFLPVIINIDAKLLSHLLEKLTSIDPDLLQEKNIIEIFDNSLDRIVLSQGRKYGEFIQPNQLTKFINSFIGSTKDKRIFNPFSGVASSIKDFSDSKSVYAQEINPKTWAIGQLRLIINQCDVDYKL